MHPRVILRTQWRVNIFLTMFKKYINRKNNNHQKWNWILALEGVVLQNFGRHSSTLTLFFIYRYIFSCTLMFLFFVQYYSSFFLYNFFYIYFFPVLSSVVHTLYASQLLYLYANSDMTTNFTFILNNFRTYSFTYFDEYIWQQL